MPRKIKDNADAEIALREQLLCRFKRIQDYVDKFNPATDDLATLKPRLKVVQECWDKMVSIPDHNQDMAVERELFEDDYFSLVAKIETFLSPLKPAGTIPGDQYQHPTTKEPDVTQQVKLPPITLPKFKGDYEHWLEFRDTFIALIHEKKDIANIQKFHYLRSSLQGDAADAIASITVSAASYEIAWELLNSRYHNDRMIITRHVRRLFEETKLDRITAVVLRQFLDNINKQLRALKSLNQPTDSWDTLLIYLVSTKLDYNTLKEWENSLTPTSIPTWSQMSEFLTRKCHSLESIESSRPSNTSVKRCNSDYQQSNSSSSSKKSFAFQRTPEKKKSSCFSAQNQNDCETCGKGSHPLYWCNKFKRLSVSERKQEVNRLNRCLNCLKKSDHSANECKSSQCKKCGAMHNSMLCDNSSMQSTDTNSVNRPALNTSLSHVSNVGTCIVLLSTVTLNVRDASGNMVSVRALLDSGSQSNFITESLAQRLGLKRHKTSVHVCGIDASQTKTSSSVVATIFSRFNGYKTSLEFLVISQITQTYPPASLRLSSFEIPSSIELGDPFFHQPGKIDMLLGAEIFFKILSIGQISLPNGASLQKTSFGWVLSGKSSDVQEPPHAVHRCNFSICLHASNQLEEQMEKFWKIEHYSKPSSLLTSEERRAEEHFQNNTFRDASGKFVITLPLKGDVTSIGFTRSIAERCLHSLTRRLDKNPDTKKRYIRFLQEYADLGHMVRAPEPLPGRFTYYIPHHPVFKEDSTTTKLRVVFNASSKGQGGHSLNELLIVGPVVQNDLFTVIVRYRQHQYVVTSDIKMMYRTLKLDPEQHNLHRILWWNESWSEIVEYSLTTLTYGTSSASFIATRCLLKIAEDIKHELPLAFPVIKKDFYMDDLITGHDSKETLIEIRSQVCAALGSAGMELRKWCSNDPSILENVPEEHRITSSNVSFDEQGYIKTLGLAWDPFSDEFRFKVSNIRDDDKVTKRIVLSEIAKLFDPLGLVGPVVVKAKILMQKLWLVKSGWDESLPMAFHTEWLQFRDQLPALENIRITRRLLPLANPLLLELHGFSDASEAAYGACIYLRSIYSDGSMNSNLICSKSRVSPIKLVTIPRLELCAAVLLAELHYKIRMALDLTISASTLWTDSTVVLGWINTSSRLKTFVANRVAQIHEHTQPSQWRHVRSQFNPADCLSRGITPEELRTSDIWWSGPIWITHTDDEWPTSDHELPDLELPELKCVQATTATITTTEENYLLARFSSLSTLTRVACYLLRFCWNCKNKDKKRLGPLTPCEIQIVSIKFIKMAQSCFKLEIKSLEREEPVSPKSRLASLHPFLDQAGQLRVGGRLSKATSISYEQRHPILLPLDHPFSTLVARSEHLRLLHAGPQALLASIRKRYWPLRGKDLVRKIYRRCVTCFRVKPTTITQLMGDLPRTRIEPARPFLHTGVDYCGPLFVKTGVRRNAKLNKCYVSVFVCFVTKAVHIELVSDLTTQAFLAALRRFVGRRGRPLKIYSDNASNFKGAKNELNELFTLFHNDHCRDSINKFCIDGMSTSIEWTFIPPRSPHHGGLWESSIKMCKYHLKRILGNSHLNFQELTTVLIQIEACLNSRPLIPQSNEPSDLSSLTPGHFLIGESPTAVVEPNLLSLKIGLLTRWQLVQRLAQQFWRRWSSEYLCNLQSRAKWCSKYPNVKDGTLVLVKEDNTPPLKWPVGRITELHHGEDGLVRVVTLQMASGIIQRSIARICPMPIHDDEFEKSTN